MNTIRFNDWAQVRHYVDDTNHFRLSELATLASFPSGPDCISLGQLASKSWMLEVISTTKDRFMSAEVAILGAWYGSWVPSLCRLVPDVRLVIGIDIDHEALERSCLYVSQTLPYMTAVRDVDELNLSSDTLIIGNVCMEFSPNIVVNTSAEHMGDGWFTTLRPGQLVIIQSNNNPWLPGHVNSCQNMADFMIKYPLNTVLWQGEMTLPIGYTRYMVVGVV